MAHESKNVAKKKMSAGKIVLMLGCALLVAGMAGCSSESKPVVTPSEGAASEQSSENGDENQSTLDLAVGTKVTLGNGLEITVNEVQAGITDYDNSTLTRVNVTYANKGDKSESFNSYDWKGEDAQGVQRDTTIYMDAVENLSSGDLTAGGTVSGNLYFEGDVAKVLYFGNIFSDEAEASWKLA